MQEPYIFDRFRLDPGDACLYRDSEVVPLTPTEYKLLLTLTEHRGVPVTRAELQKAVWGAIVVGDNNLAQHIRSLRTKLGSDPSGRPYIETLTRVGYYFRADAARPEATDASPRDNDHSQTKAEERGATRAGTLLLPAKGHAANLGRTQLKGRASVAAALFATVLAVAIALFLTWSRASGTNGSGAPIVASTAWQGPRIVRTIPVGERASRLALSSDEQFLFVAKFSADVVQVVRTQTGTVLQSIPVSRPTALALSPDGSKLYLGSQVKNIVVLNTVTRQYSTLDVGNGPVEDVALAPAGDRLYLAMGFLGVRVLDIASGSISTISKVPYARALDLTPDGSELFVSYQAGGPGGSRGHDAIGMFDAKSLRFLGSVAGFVNTGECLSASNDGSQVWENGGDVCDNPAYDHIGCPAVPSAIINVIGIQNRNLVKQIALPGTRIHCTSFTPAGTVMVTSADGLLFVDPWRYRAIASVPVDSDGRVVFDKEGQFAYVPIHEGRDIAVLKLTEEVRAIPLDDGSNRRAGLLSIALLRGNGFETKSIDPATLRFDGKPVARSSAGLPIVALQSIVGFEGLHLVVKLHEPEVAGHSVLQFQGKTYAGVVVHGKVEIPN